MKIYERPSYSLKKLKERSVQVILIDRGCVFESCLFTYAPSVHSPMPFIRRFKLLPHFLLQAFRFQDFGLRAIGVLNKAVTRNIGRFPPDFMFQLSKEEFSNLKFRFGTSSWGGTRKLPKAFTEQGVAMLSTVLKSMRAVLVNIEIMRAFVKLRRILASHAVLASKLADLEKKYDKQFAAVFEAIRQLMELPQDVRNEGTLLTNCT